MPHRYICTVLEEMRKCYKTRNFSYLLGLIEEVQGMGERMEAALAEKADYQIWHKKAKDEEAEYKRLLKETNKLRVKKGEPKKEASRY
jgi:hypothetical protein